ncbi:MAG: hypothetical protein M1308_04750 [Actinobacteria bacterium]|nr:hypothetical protein [Actinomycetota bacterium]
MVFLKGHIPWSKGKHIQLNTGRTHFKKGLIPWNKGKKLTYRHGMLGKHHTEEAKEKNRIVHLGKKVWNKGLKGILKGESNPRWKGNSVGYCALHMWIKRELGKPVECVYCGKIENIEWASISHKAKRDLNDYISLCKSCHSKYDDSITRAWITRKERMFL